VPARAILRLWQASKLTHEQTSVDLLRSRDPSALSLIKFLNYVREEEVKRAQSLSIRSLAKQLSMTLQHFRAHSVIDDWREQYTDACFGALFRFKSLLLRGASRCGKTQKAISLFGVDSTLVVNCQGLGNSLPSLQEYDRMRHAAILFDEINEQQVLCNKVVLQAGPVPVALSQSACNQHRYERWLYQVACILCANEFKMSVQEGLESEEQADWLQSNLMVAELPPGERWYGASGDDQDIAVLGGA